MADLAEYFKYFPKKVLVLANKESVDGLLSGALLERLFSRRRGVDIKMRYLSENELNNFLRQAGDKPGLVAGYDVFIADLSLSDSLFINDSQRISTMARVIKYCKAISWINHRDFSVLLSDAFVSMGGCHYYGGDETQCSASMIYEAMFKYRVGYDSELVNPAYLREIAQLSVYGSASMTSSLLKDTMDLTRIIWLANYFGDTSFFSELAREIALNHEWRVTVYRILNSFKEKEDGDLVEIDSPAKQFNLAVGSFNILSRIVHPAYPGDIVVDYLRAKYFGEYSLYMAVYLQPNCRAFVIEGEDGEDFPVHEFCEFMDGKFSNGVGNFPIDTTYGSCDAWSAEHIQIENISSFLVFKKTKSKLANSAILELAGINQA